MGPGKSCFNSGAEANEGLIKLARLFGNNRKATMSHKIVVAENGFHGRTMGALSATASVKYREGFEPLLSNFCFAPLNDIAKFQKIIDDKTTAVLVESIQGEGGIHEAKTPSLKNFIPYAKKEKFYYFWMKYKQVLGEQVNFSAFKSLVFCQMPWPWLKG